jgi:threonylcarbamoyladenosine tRNA methylthiotransferase CDKAL1
VVNLIILHILDYLIKNVPNITIATDIICGFPFETKENFEETLDLIRKYKFPVINISQFYSRPGTVAAKWKKVDSKEVKNRSSAVAKLFTSFPNYEALKGTIQRVWIHDIKDEGRNPDQSVMIAHTKSYAKVLIKRIPELIGKQAIVKVTDIHKWHVYGEIIEMHPKPIYVNFEDHFKGLYKSSLNNNINKSNEIKNEQIDIHATFKNYENDEMKTSNIKEVNLNKIDDKSSSYNIIASILYLLSIIFLYLALNKMLNYSKF